MFARKGSLAGHRQSLVLCWPGVLFRMVKRDALGDRRAISA